MAKKSIQQKLGESEAMLQARDQAAQTPDEVRKAFLSRAVTVGPVTLQPFSLGILWIFEQLKHPLGSSGGSGTLSIADCSRAIFAFVSPEEAAEALAGGAESYDQAAMTLAMGIDYAWTVQIIQAITKILSEGLATIPGGGASNPPETGS